MNLRRDFLPAFVLIALICVAYSRAPRNGMVWDDDYYLTAKHMANVNGLKRIWTDPTSVSHPYYPLTRTTLWVENYFFGRNLPLHHSINILLHICSSLLLWRILRLLQIKGAWLAAAIYGVHPVCVESVAWITERKNTLGVFFYLASLMAFLKFIKIDNANSDSYGNKILYYLSLLLFLCSLLSKTAFCTLPVVLLLILWWHYGRIDGLHIRLTIPHFLIAGILGVFTIYVEKWHTGAQGPAFQFTFLDRILIAGHAFWFYIGKIVFPYRLNFMYPRWEIHPSDWRSYIDPFSALLVIAALWAFRKKIGRGPIAAVLFFVISLLPAIGFINHFLMRYTFVADHLQYLSMIGIIVLIVSASAHILEARIPRSLLVGISAAIVFTLATLTWMQTGIYKDLPTLYDDILKKNPQCFMAYNNRGLIYLDSGNPQKAIEYFNRSLALSPDFEEALVSRGHYYYRQGKYDLAYADFNRAIEISPMFDEAYYDRGAVFFVQKKYQAALDDFNRMLYLSPASAHGYMARGVLFSATSNFDLAIQDYNRALYLDPNYGLAYLNRSKTFFEMGKHSEALADALHAKALGMTGLDPYVEQLRRINSSQ